ncbi:MAG: glycosyltransferase family 2 protein [Flavobacterium sp.]
MNQKLLISVVMITYAHENYIREAIKGVLMQEGDFDLELIIANDCSPDNTDLIISDILRSHPKADKIRYIKHDKNLGMMPNFIFALQEAKGKYIALCEGDDYWTDPYKLQKQVDFLEANSDYVLCFHPVKVLQPDGQLVDDFITDPRYNKISEDKISIKSMIDHSNFIHTPSVVYRNIIKIKQIEFNYSPVGDFLLYFELSNYGYFKRLDDVMGVYRFGVGVYSGISDHAKNKVALKFDVCLLSLTNNEDLKKILIQRLQKYIDNKENQNLISINEISWTDFIKRKLKLKKYL